MRINKAIVAAALAALTVFAAAEARALDVSRWVTPSGLTVLHVQRDKLPMVVFSLRVRAGSVREPVELQGLASLTAALLKDGTKTRTSSQISREIEFMGASLGASAGRDSASLSLSVLKKDVQKGFEVFSDILLNPIFPPEEFKRVRDRVTGSLRAREDDPSYLASRAFRAAVFGAHPYGRVTTGTPETLKRITRADVVRFHESHYNPGNSALVVVGDITKDELKRLLKQRLSGWGGSAAPWQAPEPPAPHGRKVIKIDKKLAQANIVLGHLGVDRRNPDFYALRVMNYMLGGGGFASRLMSKIRDDEGLAYDVRSYFSAGLYSGAFQVVVQTKNKSANRVISLVLGQMRKMMEEDVPAEELKDAKDYLIGSYPRKFETTGQVAGFIGQVEFFGLGLGYIEEYPELIRRVTADDVRRVAARYLNPDEFVLVVVAAQDEAEVQESPEPAR